MSLSERLREPEMSLDHVIVLMLENNSFDRMLGALFPPREDHENPGGGVKGAATNFSNIDRSTGKTYTLQPTTMREVQNDPGHDLENVLRQLEGPCKNFVNDYASKYPNSTTAERQNIMGYYEDGTLSVLHSLAKNFTVCDRWFSSLPGPTWPNRLFLYTGTSLGFTDMNAIHYWDQRTLFDLLTSHGISWRLYYGDISSTFILVDDPDPACCYPMRYFYYDVANKESQFPRFCLIEPSYFGKTPDDQHPPHDIFRGEALIAEVYNALRANKTLWERSLLVITYDEHGGFYDHIDPRSTIAPDDRRDKSGFNFDRLGVRVPTILISPWIKQAVLTDTFDHTSLLKYLISKWGLDSDYGPTTLGARAGSPETNSIQPHILTTPWDTDAVLPSVPVPDFFPPQAQVALTDHQKALAALSYSLASRITNPGTRTTLLRHDPNSSPAQQAQRAIDRFEAYLLDRAKQQTSSQAGT